jgi:8-oxo-dGTP diphosphatase
MHNKMLTKKVIAALLWNANNQILIAKRGKQDALYGKWEFPGGKLEDGETEKECLVRELKEEFGIDVIVGDYFASSLFVHKNQPYEMKMYVVKEYSGEFTLFEHAEIRFVGVKDLLQYDMPDPDKPIVNKLLEIC